MTYQNVPWIWDNILIAISQFRNFLGIVGGLIRLSSLSLFEINLIILHTYMRAWHLGQCSYTCIYMSIRRFENLLAIPDCLLALY